jgi:hypothetical protein
MRPSTASPINPYAYFQRILGVPPSPLALAEEALQHTLTAGDSILGSGNHDMSRLSTPAYLNGAPIYGLADKPLRLLPTDIGWYSGPRTQNRHKTPQLFGHKNALTATKLASFLLAVGRQSAELVTGGPGGCLPRDLVPGQEPSGAIWTLPMWAPGQIEGMRVGGVSAEESTEPHSQRKATAVRSKTQSPAKAAVNHVPRLGKSMSDCSQFSKCCKYKQAFTGVILQPRGL